VKKSLKKSSEESIKLLVENNVALQKVLTDLSLNINHLTGEVSELLKIFKEASKTFGEERAVEEVQREETRHLIGKMEDLIDQNKTVAKGLVLLESTMKEREKANYHY